MERGLIGGISARSSWYSQLLSDDVRNCEELADNAFFASLTSHFDPLTSNNNLADLEVPDDFLVDD